jgi:hypothetical protein
MNEDSQNLIGRMPKKVPTFRDRITTSAQYGASAMWSSVIFAVALAMTGCGSSKQPTYRAIGRVTFADGTPLTTGWVSFRPMDSEAKISAKGQIQPDGTFELMTFTPGDGAVEGRHQAMVMAAIVQDGRQLPQPGPPPAPLIDPRFAGYDTSGLEFTVTTDPEQNQFAIQVKPPARR